MYEKIFKRSLDFLIALLSLPIFLLIFIIIAPLILLFDGKPIFYNAERIGLNGKIFKMYKFRTMKNNAPDIRLSDGSTYNADDDPRVTKLGRFLRKTSLDETPQLLNIVKGDMSIIGPRPDTPRGAHRYIEEEKFFLKVRPGITGYSQAYFRNSVDGKTKAQNDMYYAKNISFWFDVKIFFKTISTVLLGKGIYKKEELNDLDELPKINEFKKGD